MFFHHHCCCHHHGGGNLLGAFLIGSLISEAFRRRDMQRGNNVYGNPPYGYGYDPRGGYNGYNGYNNGYNSSGNNSGNGSGGYYGMRY